MTSARRQIIEAHTMSASDAAPAIVVVTPRESLPGPPPKRGRRKAHEIQTADATSAAPARDCLKPSEIMPGPHSSTIEAIRSHHRSRRFAMGIQQVLDRKLESFIRINKTDWRPDADDKTRDAANKLVKEMIVKARKGEGDPLVIGAVAMTDKARGPADNDRARHEKEMENLAELLPVAPWIETVPGLGMLGLATIIAETGDLSNYPNVGMVWKRLGYAPYRGLAGSSWKRETWRNGQKALTKEEWIANPFSGRRYALIHTISVWLKNKQWIGVKKTEDGVGKPNGHYGEIYAARRAATAITHPDWSKGHAHMDALRVMMKDVLAELWDQWNHAS